MGFLSPALLGGVALVALPIALHLIMRRRPQRLPFPALRFVKQRRDANRRRLQLRQLALLALRCLLIAGIAAALARPTLRGTGLRGKQAAPLAIAAVIDNAPRMGYVRDDRTRLEAAVAAAEAWFERLPDDSAAAVLDRTRPSAGFALDLNTAQARLRNVRVAARPRPLADAVVEALELVASRGDARQEVFVFTDFAAEAWTEDAVARIGVALRAVPEARIYLADFGVDQPRNAALGALEIGRAALRLGEPLALEAPLTADGSFDALVVELALENADGQWEKRGEQLATVRAGQPARVQFQLADLPLGTHQGALRVAAADPLEFDDARYFTVTVRPPARILLLAEQPERAVFVQEALSPSLLAAGPRQVDCVTADYAAPRGQWDAFDAIWLLDPPPLEDAVWEQLASFAEAGGGVGVFLGAAVGDYQAFNRAAPQQVLAGPLARRSRDATFLRPQRLDHPALRGLKKYSESIPWQVYPVFQYWQLGELANDAHVLAPLANGDPALLERVAGRGRMVTMTTPLSDPVQPEGRDPWNLLPTGPEPWPFLALCDQLAAYLTHEADEPLNYQAGDTARIVLAARQHVSSFVLRQPDGQKIRRSTPAGDAEIAIGATELPGNYRLSAGGASEQLDRGFSVNVAPEQSDLSRASRDVLAAHWPAGQFRLEADPAAMEAYVNVGRSGRELFGWALGAVALLWAGEHLLANRFYRETP
jgi:hypothetical protein